MIVSRVRLQAKNIRDWESFHAECQKVFGFPDFYGKNMNAWIDCMTSLDDEGAGMTSIHVAPGAVLSLEIDNAAHLKRQRPELLEAIIEGAAFVNWRRIERCEQPVLALSFHAT